MGGWAAGSNFQQTPYCTFCSIREEVKKHPLTQDLVKKQLTKVVKVKQTFFFRNPNLFSANFPTPSFFLHTTQGLYSSGFFRSALRSTAFWSAFRSALQSINIFRSALRSTTKIIGVNSAPCQIFQQWGPWKKFRGPSKMCLFLKKKFKNFSKSLILPKKISTGVE